ncbi:hypothetical protein MKX01_012223, partial [Papaver californicum]
MGNLLSPGKSKAMPIETTFNLPSLLPSWPQSGGFGSGRTTLGGLEIRQISKFNKIWAIQEGGPENLGASFFEQSWIPDGCFSLGSCCEPNNQPLFGWVLVGKLIWSSENSKLKQDGIDYIWLPVPPEGYKAVGNIVTNSCHKPDLDKICCVHSDLTNSCEHASSLWGRDGINIYKLRPTSKGPQALGVSVGTFTTETDGTQTLSSALSLSCLKNRHSYLSSCMPNQIEALLHNLFFSSLLSSRRTISPFVCNESNPAPIGLNGMNLSQGGSSDGLYWLDLPSDKAQTLLNLQVKPMFGGTYGDIAIRVFYPFNDSAREKS